jgi:hypothetical protein
MKNLNDECICNNDSCYIFNRHNSRSRKAADHSAKGAFRRSIRCLPAAAVISFVLLNQGLGM